MEQLVENKNKSNIKTFFVIIFLVILIDFIIFILNRFNHKFPHITTIIAIVLVVLACAYILRKYFSKYLYIVKSGEIVFYIVIGKRKFKVLAVKLEDLEIQPYKDPMGKLHKAKYKFIFNEKDENIYLGIYGKGNKKESFLFSPDEKILREIKRSERNG